jgi:hypothetical protein
MAIEFLDAANALKFPDYRLFHSDKQPGGTSR